MFLRIFFTTLIIVTTMNPSYSEHNGLKGTLKSYKPSCGPTLRASTPAFINRKYINGCHGKYIGDYGIVYTGEMKYFDCCYRPGIKYHGKGILKHLKGVKLVGEFKEDDLVYGVRYENGVIVKEGKWSDLGKYTPMKTPYSPKGSSAPQQSPLKKIFKSLEADKRQTIQQKLKAEGFYNSTIDGLYGRGTEKALKDYNKKYLSNSDLKKKDNVSALLAKLQEEEAPTPKVVAKKVETKKEVVATKTDTKKINTEWQLLAEEGSAMAQYKLASMYEKGEGLLKDFVYAHMWANLSATNGYAEAKDLRDALEKKMTASQMEKAQDLARECMRKKYKGC